MTTRTDELLAEIKREFPRFRVVAKRGDRLSGLIDRVLRVVTFGAQKDYLTHYYTVATFSAGGKPFRLTLPPPSIRAGEYSSGKTIRV